eukprot:CAMPEP_0170756578 /NCGR_PEP_ID=MMETSP0437-20130122/14096_1 /TAXON_ID=0 /ORGANISM="Sexangularia sp." /LENGTH=1114 /DNA_ID=CAMNT_0011095763 /DNA_START=58 /DNA_END=3402 /DNA_ORIENTATION=+
MTVETVTPNLNQFVSQLTKHLATTIGNMKNGAFFDPATMKKQHAANNAALRRAARDGRLALALPLALFARFARAQAHLDYLHAALASLPHSTQESIDCTNEDRTADQATVDEAIAAAVSRLVDADNDAPTPGELPQIDLSSVEPALSRLLSAAKRIPLVASSSLDAAAVAVAEAKAAAAAASSTARTALDRADAEAERAAILATRLQKALEREAAYRDEAKAAAATAAATAAGGTSGSSANTDGTTGPAPGEAGASGGAPADSVTSAEVAELREQLADALSNAELRAADAAAARERAAAATTELAETRTQLRQLTDADLRETPLFRAEAAARASAQDAAAAAVTRLTSLTKAVGALHAADDKDAASTAAEVDKELQKLRKQLTASEANACRIRRERREALYALAEARQAPPSARLAAVVEELGKARVAGEEARDEEIRRIRAATDELEAAVAKAGASSDEAAAAALASARERAAAAEATAAAEAAAATEKAKKLASSLLEAEEKALTLREKRMTLGEEVRILKERARASDQALDAASKRAVAAEESVTALQASVAALRAEATAVADELATNQAAAARAKAEVGEVQATLVAKTTEVDELTVRLTRALEEVRRLEAEREAASTSRMSLAEELRNAKRRLATVSSTLQTASSSEASVAQIEAYRRRLLCAVCNDRPFNAVIRKCWHVFCVDCLERNVRDRLRKCPSCGLRFGADDVQRIYHGLDSAYWAATRPPPQAGPVAPPPGPPCLLVLPPAAAARRQWVSPCRRPWPASAAAGAAGRGVGRRQLRWRRGRQVLPPVAACRTLLRQAQRQRGLPPGARAARRAAAHDDLVPGDADRVEDWPDERAALVVAAEQQVGQPTRSVGEGQPLCQDLVVEETEARRALKEMVRVVMPAAAARAGDAHGASGSDRTSAFDLLPRGQTATLAAAPDRSTYSRLARTEMPTESVVTTPPPDAKPRPTTVPSRRRSRSAPAAPPSSPKPTRDTNTCFCPLSSLACNAGVQFDMSTSILPASPSPKDRPKAASLSAAAPSCWAALACCSASRICASLLLLCHPVGPNDPDFSEKMDRSIWVAEESEKEARRGREEEEKGGRVEVAAAAAEVTLVLLVLLVLLV